MMPLHLITYKVSNDTAITN